MSQFIGRWAFRHADSSDGTYTMRISKISFWLSLVLTIVTTSSSLWAQREIQQIPPFVTYDGGNADLAHPFIEPMTFDPDFQFFAPAEFGDYGGRPKGPTGWYAAYNRLYLNISRPRDEVSYTEGDFSWGNRIDLGWMSDENHGWSFSHLHIDGPNAYSHHVIERVNRVNRDDLANALNPNGNAGGGGGGGNAANQLVFPVSDRNDPNTLTRVYDLQQSLNSGDLVGFELNKTFRIDQLHYGSTLEPFFGLRYNKFRDYFKRQTYGRFDALGGAVGNFPADVNDTVTEQLTTQFANWDNHMVGGQIGMRWFTQKSRWDLSTELRVFAMQNFQNFYTYTDQERTFYAGPGDDAAVDGILVERITGGGHNGEFTFGTDIRAAAAYNVTRDIRLSGGLQFMDYAVGIARGGNLNRNAEDLIMVGFNFGFEINR